MKKHFYFRILLLFLFLAPASYAHNKVAKPKATGIENNLTAEQQQAQFQQYKARIMEIKAMDKSHLTYAERRALRKELYRIKSEMKGFTSGGVYLSAAAIIIIILVLILIV
ncbi:MAG: hypothetical protein ACKOW2_07770 [Sphingobacteriaceae bacterium]